MSLWEKWGIGLLSTAHFRPAATGGPQTTQRYIEGDTDAKRKLVQLI
jgi:hypothetical protein